MYIREGTINLEHFFSRLTSPPPLPCIYLQNVSFVVELAIDFINK